MILAPAALVLSAWLTKGTNFSHAGHIGMWNIVLGWASEPFGGEFVNDLQPDFETYITGSEARG